MRVAVVGLGVIGKVHLKVIAETDNQLVSVCDINGDKLASFSNVSVYTDYVTMLENEKIDVVHICTPHYLHTQMIIEALNRNINVLCEKPLCIKKEDIPLILSAEQKSTAQLGVCFQNRYNTSTLLVKEYLKNEEIISATASLRWHRDKEYYLQGGWRGKKNTEGGGVLINQALHTIDLLQYFCGMPKSICAVCENLSLQGVIEVEDTATLTLFGENQVTLYATNTAERDYPVEIKVQTKSATVRMLPDCVWINEVMHDCKNISEIYGKKVYGIGHRSLIKDYYDCISANRKFEIDGKEASKAVMIVLSAYESNGNVFDIKN